MKGKKFRIAVDRGSFVPSINLPHINSTNRLGRHPVFRFGYICGTSTGKPGVSCSEHFAPAWWVEGMRVAHTQGRGTWSPEEDMQLPSGSR